jgi:hypothetical protein
VFLKKPDQVAEHPFWKSGFTRCLIFDMDQKEGFSVQSGREGHILEASLDHDIQKLLFAQRDICKKLLLQKDEGIGFQVGQDLREEKIQKIEKKRGEQLLEELVMICFHSLDYKGAASRHRAGSVSAGLMALA